MTRSKNERGGEKTKRGRYGETTEGSDEGLIYHHAPFNEAQSFSQNEDTARARGFLLHFARPPPAGFSSSAILK